MTLASALILGGSIADRFGAHRIFTIGVIGFAVASLCCAAAPSLAVLLVARAALGVFAAAVVPSSVSLIAGLYPVPEVRMRAVGIWAGISGSAMVVGPLAGGWLIALGSWRLVFVINAPVALVVVCVCRRTDQATRGTRSVSWTSHAALGAALAAGTFAVVALGQHRWVTGVLGVVLAAGVLVGVRRIEQRSSTPIVPVALSCNPRFWKTLARGAAINYALTTVIFTVPLLTHATDSGAGVPLLPLTVVIALGPPVTGRLVARLGALPVIRLGLVAVSLGLTVDAVAFANGVHDILWAGMLLCGVGVSCTLPALIASAVDVAGPTLAGTVGGLVNAARQVGATLAAASGSALLAHPDGRKHATIAFAIAVAMCAVAAGTVERQRSAGPATQRA